MENYEEWCVPGQTESISKLSPTRPANPEQWTIRSNCSKQIVCDVEMMWLKCRHSSHIFFEESATEHGQEIMHDAWHCVGMFEERLERGIKTGDSYLPFTVETV